MTNAEKFKEIFGIDFWKNIKNGKLESGRWADEEFDKNMDHVSDGYHTFEQLYHQRAILFAVIVNTYPWLSWKTKKHEDGNYCFDKNGEWFLACIETPKGNYSYHYKTEDYWDLFNCDEIEKAKAFDGHTEKDVDRLLSLDPRTWEWFGAFVMLMNKEK